MSEMLASRVSGSSVLGSHAFMGERKGEYQAERVRNLFARRQPGDYVHAHYDTRNPDDVLAHESFLRGIGVCIEDLVLVEGQDGPDGHLRTSIPQYGGMLHRLVNAVEDGHAINYHAYFEDKRRF